MRQFRTAFGCLLYAAICLYLGTGLYPIWWLTWIASIPLLWVSARLTARGSFVTTFVAFALGGMNMWHYLHGILLVPTSLCLVAVLFPALVNSVSVLLFRALVLRGNLIWAVVSFPSSVVASEYVSSLVSPHGTFGSLAYTQMNFLPILQLASFTGIWGITFVVLLFSSAVAVLLPSESDFPKLPAALLAAVVLIAAFGYGAVRLHQSAPPADTTVGLIASDLPENLIAGSHDDALRLLRTYAEAASKLAAQGARVVVIPEKLAVTPDSYIAEVDALFNSAAHNSNIWIVVGLVHPTANAKWNEARVYSPDGSVAATYGKHHMLPPYESSFTVGNVRTLLRQPQGFWGVTICKDMDFPQLSREYGRDGAGLLLVPAWDFTADGWLHGRMAIMRSVENGFSMARAPKQGLLTVNDDRGRVLAETRSDTEPFTTLVARVCSVHEATFYDRFGGTWFALACVVIAISGVFRVVLRARHGGMSRAAIQS